MKKLIFLLLFSSLCFGEFQKVNPDYKLLNIKGYVEMYSSGEEQLYVIFSPHDKKYSPQGWRHREEITIDFRRLKADLLVWDYLPLFFSLYFQTEPYFPYADSLQIIGTEVGLNIPFITKYLTIKLSGVPETWSGHQVSVFNMGLEFQNNFGIAKEQDYYLFNFNILYRQTSLISIFRYIGKSEYGEDWTANKSINANITADLRAINIGLYIGYNLDYRWNDDLSQLPIDKKFVKHSILLGNTTELTNDLSLTYEGSFEFVNGIRLMRTKAILNYRMY